MHGRDLRGSLSNGGLEDFPGICPGSHLKGALLIGQACYGERGVKQQAFSRIPKGAQVKPQPQTGKCAVAGIGKGPGKILMPMGRAVIAFYPVVPVYVHAAAVKLIIPVTAGMFPHIFQGSHDLEGGARRV